MATMILLRHGQSVWNAANKFTGWTDVELSEVGEAEAAKAGEDLAEIEIDIVHTSDLIRAQRTAAIGSWISSTRRAAAYNFYAQMLRAHRVHALQKCYCLLLASVSQTARSAAHTRRTPSRIYI